MTVALYDSSRHSRALLSFLLACMLIVPFGAPNAAMASGGKVTQQRVAKVSKAKPRFSSRLVRTGMALLVVGALSTGCATKQANFTGYDAAVVPQKIKTVTSEMIKKGSELVDKKVVFREHSGSIFSFPAGEHASLVMKAKVRGLRPDSAEVSGNADRVKLLAEHKDQYTWTKSRAQVNLGAGFTFTLPEGGWITVNGGTRLEYAKIAPQKGKYSAVLHGATEFAQKPIFSDRAMLSEAPGTQVAYIAEAHYGTQTGVGKGVGIPIVGDVNVVAKVGTEASATGRHRVAVVMTRLGEGNRVNVQIHRIDEASLGNFTGAKVGLDSFPSSGTGAVAKVADRGAESILKSLLKMKVGHQQNYSWSNGQLSSTTVDFDKQTTFVAKGKNSARGVGEGGDVRVGPLKLYKKISAATKKSGTVRVGEGQTISYGRTELRGSSGHILNYLGIGKKQEIAAELVSFHFPGKKSQTYVRSQVEEKQYFTNAREARGLVALALILGAEPKDPSQLNGIGKSGTMLLKADTYVTGEGLQRFTKAPIASVEKAMSAAHETTHQANRNPFNGTTENVLQTSPWLAKSHPKYARIMALLKAGPQSSVETGSNENAAKKTPQEEYHKITGRSLFKDVEGFRTRNAVLALRTELAAAKTPKARANAYYEARKTLSFDKLLMALATIAQVAGPKEVLVDKLVIERSRGGKNIHFVHTGRIVDPQAIVDRMLADPSSL